jgi:hypothetical protein
MSQGWEAAEARIARIEAGIAKLDGHTREPPPASDDAPLFVASIGWRSGSTLMQRVLMTDPSVLIWGEPLDRLAMLGRLTDAVAAIDQEWPPADNWITSRGPTDLARDWVANLYPDPGAFKAGLRAMLDAWLAAPAKARGRPRWGVKEVRWTGADGLLLRWLYPRARFVVIARHPVSAYYSLRHFGLEPRKWGVWVRWPDQIIGDHQGFANHWNELALSWLAVADRLGARVIRYEDLAAGRADLAALGADLGLTLDPGVALDAKVGGSDYALTITAEEKTEINALTAEGRARLHYAE